MASEHIYVVVYPNGEISHTAEGVTFMCDDPLWIMIPPQSSLQQLKNLILMNTELVGKKEISTLIYKMPVAAATSRCWGSSSSLNNVEELRNFGAGEAIPFPEIGRPRSPSFNAFVVPTQNAKNPHERSSLTTHVAFSEGNADRLADSSDEDKIEDDSGDEAEVVAETQPLQEETFIPTQVEPINVMGLGGVSSNTPGHYLQLSLSPMHSTTAEDIPSNYALISEMELEIGLKFLNKETTMLVVKNYSIRRSAELKAVELDHTRYVCRCKLFGEQYRWMVRVAKTRASRFWKIRKFQGTHSCLAFATLQDHVQLDSNVIFQHIFPMVQVDATICIKMLQGSVESVYGYKASYKKV
ncbi:uncharacterized protein LOC130975550 [Arachis stenosperma]|uniref:uncharacterized protein LOC130975550 n=1 Tax=Arachis stenosperma TaxID=217475 RepID=UPI0025AB79EA|nr:uncharacterized protein LOC130975550 [Arachis stenosperma]